MRKWDELFQIIAGSLLAAFGALARLLNIKEKETLSVTKIASGCVVAAFAGLLMHFIAAYFMMDPNLAYVLAGICGWGGPQILDMLSSTVLKRSGIGEDEQGGKKR